MSGLAERDWFSCWSREEWNMAETAKLILVVDDDPHTRRLLDISCRTAGFATLLAANGLQALEQLQEQTPDLILTDALMPNLDGYGLIREVKTTDRLRRIPVILLTGADDADTADRAFQPDCILQKPFAISALLETINGSLSGSDPWP